MYCLSSCGGDGSIGPPPPPPPVIPATVATVTITPATLPLVLGQSGQLTPNVLDAAGNKLTGRVVTWGTNNPGIASVSLDGLVIAAALGTATITATSEGKTGNAQVTVISIPIVAFASVVTGGAHTCALTAAGAAYCWGRGESGQLGVPSPASTCPIDTQTFPCSLIPTSVGGSVVFARLAAGGAHTCGLTSDGSAYCWGSNSVGQLGDNSTTNRDVLVPVATALKFASIDAGVQHTCALTSDGVAYCWGRNDRGQLGDGTTALRSVPVKVAGNRTFRSVSAGGFNLGQTCALTADGDAWCWGDNERGQLGIASADVLSHPIPAQVSGGLKFVALSTGLGRHTCGRIATGAGFCWGENSFGALGNGTVTDSPVPVLVTGVTFSELVAGGFIGHTCGLASSGTAYCWGENEVGALGDGTTVDRFTPAAVVVALVWTSIDAGFRHTCARASTGAIYCWGSGRAGQLGTNSVSESHSPSKVVGQP